MTGIIHHDLFAKHLEGYGHVENPERYRVIMERLRDCPFSADLDFIEAQSATTELLELVHDEKYVYDILSMKIDSPVVLDWGDTVATLHSQQAALRAAGAGVQAARLVLSGAIDTAFCPVRPPGHHAERDRAMGFCIFNNIAIAASWLVGEGGLKRVAIVDWDVHHGNGTERAFFNDDRVLYISLHQYPHYPGTGHFNTVGAGKGAGFTINLPVGAGADDEQYLSRFHERIMPALDEFRPEFILISAGFDAHGDDPLSGCRLTTGAFGEMTRLLRESAKKNCGGMIVSMLEGGYDLDALADSVESHVKALLPEA